MEVYERIWNDTVRQLSFTAAFDLQCPREELEYSLLDRQARYPSQVGVTGCGQRVRYVRNFATSVWVANSTNSTSAPSPTTGATAPAEIAAPATLCNLAPGKWEGPLRVDGMAVAQSGYARELVLMEHSVRAHLSGGGWHVYGEGDLRQDPILRARQTMWVGEGVAVPVGARVMLLAAEPGRVEVGLPPTPGVTFSDPSSRSVPCAAVGLDAEEQNVDAVLESLSLAQGRAAHVSTFTLSHLPGGEPFVRQEEGVMAEARSVRVIEERHGFTRVAGYLHGGGGGSLALLVGWTQATVESVVSGNVMAAAGPDVTSDRRCRVPRDLPLFAEAQGLAKQEVGRIESGTTLWARPSEGGGWSVHPVLGDGALQLAEEVEMSIQPGAPLVCERASAP